MREDMQRAWDAAREGSDAPVDFCVFTVGQYYVVLIGGDIQTHSACCYSGGFPSFKLTRGFVISPPNLVTQSMFNVIATMPKSARLPKLIAITSAGLTKKSHAQLPLAWKLMYSYLIAQPHLDKLGTERVISHCAGWKWAEKEPSQEILAQGWDKDEGLPAAGTFKDVLVLRPLFLTDGACKAEKGGTYRAQEQGIPGAYTISRKDVAHFLVEQGVKHWEEWRGKTVTIAY